MSKPLLEAILFDLDGTLIDTAPDFAVVVNQLRQRHGKTPIEYARIRATVSHGARALITLAFELQESDSGFEDLRQELLTLYSAHLCVKTTLFPGIDQLLNWIEQQPLVWGIVTNKPRQYAEAILQGLNLSERCGVLVCPDDVSQTKPHPEPMLLACRTLKTKAPNTLYIGDHRRDIEAGKNANMPTMAANYGYIEAAEPTQNWAADLYVDHANQIKGILETHFSYE